MPTKSIPTLVGALLVACGLPLFAADSGPSTGHEGHVRASGNHAHHMHEGAISFKGSDGRVHSATVLGGKLGQDTADGTVVGIHVLQAESPERLKPAGRGPTHLFNLTFVEEGESKLLEEVLGALLVTGEGEPQRVAFRRHASHFQAAVRLPAPGDYQLRVVFVVQGHSSTTKPVPFRYRWSPAVTKAIQGLAIPAPVRKDEPAS